MLRVLAGFVSECQRVEFPAYLIHSLPKVEAINPSAYTSNSTQKYEVYRWEKETNEARKEKSIVVPTAKNVLGKNQLARPKKLN
jgi:hypothetical protein